MTEDEWATLHPFADALATASRRFHNVSGFGENADPVLAIRFKIEMDDAELALKAALADLRAPKHTKKGTPG
jgi:hypothetical protein